MSLETGRKGTLVHNGRRQGGIVSCEVLRSGAYRCEEVS